MSEEHIANLQKRIQELEKANQELMFNEEKEVWTLAASAAIANGDTTNDASKKAAAIVGRFNKRFNND